MNKRRSKREIRATAVDWLARIDSGNSDGDRAEFAQWCAAGARHREVVAELQRAWAVLDGRSTGNDAERIRIGLQRRMTVRAKRRAAAATACLLIGLVGVHQWNLRSRAPEQEMASVVRYVETTRISLPDGSEAELSSEARIDTSFSDEVRQVTLLAGDAHFHVRVDATRPFVVVADGVRVRAVGTAFAVGVALSEVQVVVTSGAVSVGESGDLAPSAAEADDAATLLGAGQALVVSADASKPKMPITLDEVELARRLAWRVPRLEFTDTSLRDALTLFNQRNDVRLELADSSLEKLRISGVFRADNSEGFAELLERPFPLTAERVGSEIVLRRRIQR